MSSVFVTKPFKIFFRADSNTEQAVRGNWSHFQGWV